MKLDILPADNWDSLNEEIAEQLLPPTDTGLRVFSGLGHAVYEIVLGAAHFYSHKKYMGQVRGLSPWFEFCFSHLFKEGFQDQVYEDPQQSFQIFADQLKPETNFVLFAEDHPITGELYPWQEWDRILNEKKIFAIRVSHSAHLREPTLPELGRFSVRICGFGPDLALAHLGARFKAPALMAPALYWNHEERLESLKIQQNEFFEEKSLVTAFEKELPSPFQPYFAPAAQRLFDRAVVYSETHTAEALQFELAQVMGLNLKQSPFEQKIETPNLCRWGGIRLFEDWWSNRPSANILRGFLVIAASQLRNADFKKYFDLAIERVNAKSNL